MHEVKQYEVTCINSFHESFVHIRVLILESSLQRLRMYRAWLPFLVSKFSIISNFFCHFFYVILFVCEIHALWPIVNSQFRESHKFHISLLKMQSLHFILLIGPLKNYFLFMTGIVITFNVMPRNSFSVLAPELQNKVSLMFLSGTTTFRVLSNSASARYRVHFLFWKETRFLTIPTKYPALNPIFQSILKIIVSSLVPHTSLFLYWILNHQHSLCGNVTTELSKTSVLLSQFDNMKQLTLHRIHRQFSSTDWSKWLAYLDLYEICDKLIQFITEYMSIIKVCNFTYRIIHIKFRYR
jgi:hypothetical protein